MNNFRTPVLSTGLLILALVGCSGTDSEDGGNKKTAGGSAPACPVYQNLSTQDLLTATGAGIGLIGGEERTWTDVGVEEIEGTPSVYASAGGDTLIIPLSNDEEPTGTVTWVTGEGQVFTGNAQVSMDESTGSITVQETTLTSSSSEETLKVSTCFAIGTGSSRIEVDGTVAKISGTLGSLTFAQVTRVLKDFPEIETLEFLDVPGSSNDEVNVETGRLVRGAGWNTVVLENSEVSQQ